MFIGEKKSFFTLTLYKTASSRDFSSKQFLLVDQCGPNLHCATRQRCWGVQRSSGERRYKLSSVLDAFCKFMVVHASSQQ